MKRKWIFVLSMICVMGLAGGCGSKEGEQEISNTAADSDEGLASGEKAEEESTPDIFLKDFEVEKYVTLGEYKGLQVQVSNLEVDEEEVEQDIRNFYSEGLAYLSGVTIDDGIMDRAVQVGDIVNIDYEGKKDGVAFEGGTAQAAHLEIGSGRFIPGFEDGLIGKNPGETVDLELTFPENYGTAELAGAKVVFTVKINYILPEGYSDKLVGEICSLYGLSGISDYAGLKDYVTASYEAEIQSEISDAVMEVFMDSCQFAEIPDVLTEKYRKVAKQNIEQTAASYYMDADNYIYVMYGMTLDEFLDNLLDFSMKQNVALQALANKENLNATDEEVNTNLQQYADQAGFDSVDSYLQAVGNVTREDFREYLTLNHATDFLVKNAKVSVSGN